MEELKQQLLYEMKTGKRCGIYGLTQRTLAYNSNRIEGSTLTERQTASMFETGTIDSENDIYFRTKDIFRNLTDYFEEEQNAFYEETKGVVLSYDIIKHHR